VGIFPNLQTFLRLLGAVLEELHEDCVVSCCYFGQQSMWQLQQETKLAPILTIGEEI
jgi:hypothetical protein